MLSSKMGSCLLFFMINYSVNWSVERTELMEKIRLIL